MQRQLCKMKQIDASVKDIAQIGIIDMIEIVRIARTK